MPTPEFRASFITIINQINREIFDLMEGKADDFSDLIRNLHAFIHNRTDSLLILVQNDCLWDADIILRPIAEASVKIAFISRGTEEQRIAKTLFFWNELGEINTLKRSKQTRELLSTVNMKSEILSNLVLSEDVERTLNDKWTKSERQKVEQPWSYNEMIKIIANTLGQNEILSLARNFTQSSHLIHADESALGVIRDRLMRDVDDREVQINLHEIRLFSDCVAFSSWNLFTLADIFKVEIKLEIKKALEEFYLNLKILQKQIL